MTINSIARLSMIALGYNPHVDLSIESMQSKRFSVGVFIFLLIGIVVFASVIVSFMRREGGFSKMRVGERIMFVAIIMGVVVAVLFAASQMLEGFLF